MPTAVITGASSGIGAAFARSLAATGHDLLLVARRANRLAELREELQARHPVGIEALTIDLADAVALDTLVSRTAALDRLDILVNNAGFATCGKFADLAPAGPERMVGVHVLASVRLCRAVLPGMVARRSGAIINVSSLAAFLPISGSATYCATKAFLVTFSEALQDELRGTGVRVQALCPGFTRTEFHDTEEMNNSSQRAVPGWLWMSAERVVEVSLRALKHGRVVCIPGALNRLIAELMGCRLTRPLLKRICR